MIYIDPEKELLFQQAVEAMKNGKTVVHRYFSEDEWTAA